jgi:hypothetical protein
LIFPHLWFLEVPFFCPDFYGNFPHRISRVWLFCRRVELGVDQYWSADKKGSNAIITRSPFAFVPFPNKIVPFYQNLSTYPKYK